MTRLNARRNASTPEFHESPLLPTLAAELDTVSAVSVRKGAATPTVSLHKSGTQWTVAERGDYPADTAKLRKLLISLGDAKIVEEKTNNPAEFSLIGVEDPGQSGASGTEVSLTARDGKHAVIIGKPSGQGDFARRAGENQSYLIQPAISLETEPRYWIDSHLMDIPAADIESMDVKPAGGPGYVLKRVKSKDSEPGADKSAADKSADPEYVLEGVPPGRKAADARTLAPSPSLGGALSADDVAFAKDLDFSKPSSATLTLAPPPLAPPPPAPPPPTPADKDKAATAAPAPAAPATAPATAAPAAAAPATAAADKGNDVRVIKLLGSVIGDKHWIVIESGADAALAPRLAGRAFEIPSYRYDAIFRPLEQLLVPKPTPAAKGASGAASKPDASVKGVGSKAGSKSGAGSKHSDMAAPTSPP
jgi:hypothetical protein